MRGPRRKDESSGPGGRALERLRFWERARGLPEREATPPPPGGARDEPSCVAPEERDRESGDAGR